MRLEDFSLQFFAAGFSKQEVVEIMQYRLGNNQLKELLVRGTPLCICLPTPEEYPDDELAWARQSLGEYGEFVVAADRIDVCVTPSADSGLTGVIGAIVAEPFPDQLTWWVDVIQCHLNPPKSIRPRHNRSRPQWPGYAITKAG